MRSENAWNWAASSGRTTHCHSVTTSPIRSLDLIRPTAKALAPAASGDMVMPRESISMASNSAFTRSTLSAPAKADSNSPVSAAWRRAFRTATIASATVTVASNAKTA